MFQRVHSPRWGKDGVGVFEEERLDFGSLGVGVAPAHLDQGLGETAVEKEVARQVCVGPCAHVEHADEGAPKALAEAHSIGR